MPSVESSPAFRRALPVLLAFLLASVLIVFLGDFTACGMSFWIGSLLRFGLYGNFILRTVVFILELFLSLKQSLFLLLTDSRIGEVEFFHLVVEHGRHGKTREPLVIGRHDIPGRPLSTCVVEHVFVSVDIVVPECPLFHIGCGELPVLLRHHRSLHETLLLGLFGHIEEYLGDNDSVVNQVLLEVVNLLEAPPPDTLIFHRGRELLAGEELGMNAHDQDFFIIGTVENPDAAARRQGLEIAPQIIVVLFLTGRSLETVDIDPLPG